MMVCLCNPFNDKKVREHLSKVEDQPSVLELYEACSGGQSPQCCACIETLKDMLKEHNESINA